MKQCVLTFDDGFRSHFDFVRPLLKEYNFTGTFFVSGSFIASESAVRRPRRTDGYHSHTITEYMTWDEITIMHRDGFEIGNHLFKHLDMRKHNVLELTKNADALDQRLLSFGVDKTKTIAYPGFLFNNTVFEFAKQYGFKLGRTGCEKTLKFDEYQFGGKGMAFMPQQENRLDVNCTFVFGQKYKANDFIKDVLSIKDDEISVLCFHDFNPSGLSVDISADDFLKILNYLRKNNFKTVKFCDLP